MTKCQFAKTIGAGAALGVLALAGLLITSPKGQAQNGNEFGADAVAKIRKGFAVAPVPLNLAGKSLLQINLIGMGSYLVNAENDCNFCHNGGGFPNFNFLAGHNPYFLNQSPKKTDPSVYLAGGQDFGPINLDGTGPHIVSRNLTPDRYGLPEGGHNLAQFTDILRNGIDLDRIHQNCSAAITNNCAEAPVDGSKLQIMPWPDFQDMTDSDIQAIWEYLSVIPCIDNAASTPPAGAPNELRNNCGK
jgi:hypothetical protein